MSLEQPEASIILTKPVKIEEDAQFKSNPVCSTSDLNGGSKSRQQLTEAEKEARRLRRVLANRESARQTIRRRQAMFEELTRKAVDLAVDNDHLKEDKEVAMKEYESLKSINDCLQAQIAEIMKSKAEIEEESKPYNNETSTSVPTATPSFPYNLASVVPFHWPMRAQPSEASIDRCRSESGIGAPLVPMMQLWKPDSFLDQGNSVMIANPGTLLCLLPFPCLFPFHAPSSAGHPQFSELNEKQNETTSIHQCTASVSSNQMLKSESSLPLNIKMQVLNSAGSMLAEVPHQAALGSLPDNGGGEGNGHQGAVLVPAPLNCVRPVASVGPFTALHQDESANVVPIPSTGEHTAESSPHGSQEETIQPWQKAADAIAATEARRRRKELIKLKNLHAQQ